jgi:hypothetical protein
MFQLIRLIQIAEIISRMEEPSPTFPTATCLARETPLKPVVLEIA